MSTYVEQNIDRMALWAHEDTVRCWGILCWIGTNLFRCQRDPKALLLVRLIWMEDALYLAYH